MYNNLFFWTISGGYLFNIIKDTYDLKFDKERYKQFENLPALKILTNHYFNWGTIGGICIGFVRWYHDKPLLL